MNDVNKLDKNRIKFVLSYVNIFTLFFSIIYSILLILSHINVFIKNKNIEIFPIYLSIIIPILFLTSFILNRKNRYYLSKFTSISTILTINFIAGVYWGFDLPSALISYLFCIVIVALTSKTKENIIYNLILISSIFIGNYLRNYLNIETSWYNSSFGANDVLEFSVMFIFISFLLIKFNQEQNKTLNRAIRAEYTLKQERDSLEKTLEQKTNEIKQMQMEEISKIYHLVEFGKLSSGLYHDLITPIQTMSLYLENINSDKDKDLYRNDKLKKSIIGVKNSHEKLLSMINNIRRQMSLKIEDEEINIITEINLLLELIKNNYFKNNVEVRVNTSNVISKKVYTKKYILNHIILNLLSNSYEACIQDKEINNKEKYLIEVILGQHENRNYISVKDNGIGIKERDIKNIFDSFYSNKKNKEKNNCGIGLSSAKYYTEKYLNGKIYTESDYNLGTTMTLLF